jgi:hypothetical protein
MQISHGDASMSTRMQFGQRGDSSAGSELDSATPEQIKNESHMAINSEFQSFLRISDCVKLE